jgi:hypothetical protein
MKKNCPGRAFYFGRLFKIYSKRFYRNEKAGGRKFSKTTV